MRMRAGLLCALMLFCIATFAEDRVQIQRDDAKGQLTVTIDGREALVYQYANTLDLAHYFPLNSPSGKNMLVQQTNPYPHHRSFWFGDTVQLAGGRKVSFYGAYYSSKERKPPFPDHVRHVTFAKTETKGDTALIETELVWEMDGDKPVLDEHRAMRIVALGNGEYLLDVTFTLAASHGDVAFLSDAVHYAWPYIRITERFNGEHGGTIINDKGETKQKGTNMKPALWIDYSNTVDGTAEGLAVFQWPDGGEHKWLTREYGTFGPRRVDERSGKPFTLTKGQTITQRVGILVHRGDVTSGRVAERYKQYVDGKL